MFIEKWTENQSIGKSSWEEVFVWEPQTRQVVYGITFHVSTAQIDLRVEFGSDSFDIDLYEIDYDYYLYGYDYGASTDPVAGIPEWIYAYAPNRYTMKFPDPVSVSNGFRILMKAQQQNNRTLYRGMTIRSNR